MEANEINILTNRVREIGINQTTIPKSIIVIDTGRPDMRLILEISSISPIRIIVTVDMNTLLANQISTFSIPGSEGNPWFVKRKMIDRRTSKLLST